MTKLFKNSKRIFAFVIAFAIIACALFTGVVINSDAACKSNGSARTIYWSGNQTAPASTAAGTANDPIVINTAEELAYIIAKAKADNTKGKHYKIADDIGKIVLQPEGNAAILNLADAAAVKNYFENTAGLKEWVQTAWEQTSFCGMFDGNGVEFYGMYQKTAGREQGLFPEVDAGAIIKNFTLKNSYTYSETANYDSALISARSNGTSYGAKADGIIVYDTIAVINCYMQKTSDNHTRVGLFTGELNDVALIKNCVVYGNTATYKVNSSTYDTALIGIAKNSLLAANVTSDYIDEMVKNENFLCQTVKDTIVFGAAPYNPNQSAWRYGAPYCYSNVYTDTLPTLTIGGSVQAFKEEQAKKIDPSQLDYSNAAEICPGLDWQNVWFMSENGPVLRAFHGEIKLTSDHTTHYYACADCNLKSKPIAHTWLSDRCTVCNYVCRHNGPNEQVIENRAATCVEPAGTYTYCKNCEWSSINSYGTVNGHQLEWVDEIPADCQNTGVKGYWHCTVCNGNYLGATEAEAKWAAMDTSIQNPATELIIPLASHDAHDRDNGGIIVRSNESGHWYLCYTCDGRLESVISDELAPDDAVVKHSFVDGVCSECGWECKNHNYVSTGNILVVGSCSVDRQEEVKCTICGKKETLVTPAKHNIEYVAEVAATDKLEGTKAHYECTVCQEIFADAEGTTKATKASLVIPKVLPAGYENVVINGNGNLNADTGTKSPATGDNAALAVMSVIALAGAAFVIVRKTVKE